MSDRDRRNGNGSVPDPFKRRPPLAIVPRPDDDEALRGPVVGIIDAVNAMSSKVNSIDDDVLALNLAVFDMAKDVREIKAHLVPGALPAMREQMPSTTVVLQEAKAALATELALKASQSPGPYVDAKPEEITEIAEKVFARELAKREQAKELERLQSKEREDQAARDREKEGRRRIREQVIGGVLVGLALIVAGYLFGRVTSPRGAATQPATTQDAPK